MVKLTQRQVRRAPDRLWACSPNQLPAGCGVVMTPETHAAWEAVYFHEHLLTIAMLQLWKAHVMRCRLAGLVSAEGAQQEIKLGRDALLRKQHEDMRGRKRALAALNRRGDARAFGSTATPDWAPTNRNQRIRRK